MGMIDFGWYLKLNHDLTRANNQGARVAAYSGSDSEVTQAIVDASPATLNVSESSISIQREKSSMSRGSSVTVATNSNYSSLTNFSFVHFLLEGKDLNSSSVIRIE